MFLLRFSFLRVTYMVGMGMIFSTLCEKVDMCGRRYFISLDALEAVMGVAMLLDVSRADCFVTLFIFLFVRVRVIVFCWTNLILTLCRMSCINGLDFLMFLLALVEVVSLGGVPTEGV